MCKEEGGEGRDGGSGIICECGEGLLSISRLDGQLLEMLCVSAVSQKIFNILWSENRVKPEN